MKHRLGAAAFAVACTLATGAVFAGGIEGSCTALRYFDDVVAGVTRTNEIENLRHNATTQHQFIGDPNLIPPGACRNIALNWNFAAGQKSPSGTFSELLAASATNGCRLEYMRSDMLSQDGTFELFSVRPAR